MGTPPSSPPLPFVTPEAVPVDEPRQRQHEDSLVVALLEDHVPRQRQLRQAEPDQHSRVNAAVARDAVTNEQNTRR